LANPNNAPTLPVNKATQTKTIMTRAKKLYQYLDKHIQIELKRKTINRYMNTAINPDMHFEHIIHERDLFYLRCFLKHNGEMFIDGVHLKYDARFKAFVKNYFSIKQSIRQLMAEWVETRFHCEIGTISDGRSWIDRKR
jgi:hypothetical protein